ncbi:hypothetical protein [Microvirga solisilvae]|uniref:hypothetical protein n=1 Tax=Microvirga solisilvae TaxID=2919498 RepID=UPI001FB02F0F|nr:hypothetical protein [Microvirga solisilvae]
MADTFVKLGDPEHKLPLPGVPGAFFPAGLHKVDDADPFWFGCLADGSLVRATDDEIKAATAPAEAPSEKPTRAAART